MPHETMQQTLHLLALAWPILRAAEGELIRLVSLQSPVIPFRGDHPPPLPTPNPRALRAFATSGCVHRLRCEREAIYGAAIAALLQSGFPPRRRLAVGVAGLARRAASHKDATVRRGKRS